MPSKGGLLHARESFAASSRYKKVQAAISAAEAAGLVRCEPVDDNMLDPLGAQQLCFFSCTRL